MVSSVATGRALVLGDAGAGLEGRVQGHPSREEGPGGGQALVREGPALAGRLVRGAAGGRKS